MNERHLLPMLLLILSPLIVLSVGCVTRQSGEVVVLSALDREFAEPVLDDVGDELSLPFRIKYDVESNKTVGLTNEIIRNQQRPRADLFWNNEILHTIRLQKLGLLEPLRIDVGIARGTIPQTICFAHRSLVWFRRAGSGVDREHGTDAGFRIAPSFVFRFSRHSIQR